MIFEIENYRALKSAMDEFCTFLHEQNVHSESVFDCKLVAYELLGNVLRHSTGGAKLLGEIRDGFIEMRITTSKAFTPPKESVCAEVYSEHGRGLFLVDKLCAQKETSVDGTLLLKIRIKE